MTEIEKAIQGYILKEIMFSEDESALPLDRPLLEDGIIDSMDLQRLVVFLEEKFDVTVQDEQLVGTNFENVTSIGQLVQTIRAS